MEENSQEFSENKEFSGLAAYCAANSLTKSQRAAVAAEVLRANSTRIQVDSIGRALGIGHSTVECAQYVMRRDPELFKRIKSGEIKADTAYDKLRGKSRPPRAARTPNVNPVWSGSARIDRSAPFHPATDYQKRLALVQQERLVRAVSLINGVCTGLKELDIPMAVSAIDNDERGAWVKKVRLLARNLKELAKKLEVSK
jgi:hypothetical protein